MFELCLNGDGCYCIRGWDSKRDADVPDGGNALHCFHDARNIIAWVSCLHHCRSKLEPLNALEGWTGSEYRFVPFRLKIKARCYWVLVAFLSSVKGVWNFQGSQSFVLSKSWGRFGALRRNAYHSVHMIKSTPLFHSSDRTLTLIRYVLLQGRCTGLFFDCGGFSFFWLLFDWFKLQEIVCIRFTNDSVPFQTSWKGTISWMEFEIRLLMLHWTAHSIQTILISGLQLNPKMATEISTNKNKYIVSR